MHVRMGWSGETSSNVWQKVDIELEENDLNRLMTENDFPELLHMRLPVKVCYQLLHNEAEMLLLTKLKHLGYPQDTADDRIGVLARNSADIIGAVKQQLTAA